MKKISLFLLITNSFLSCKKDANTNTISPEEKAKNEKIRNHFVIVTGELDKFMNSKKLNEGSKFEDNYLITLPYAINYIQQMKEVGFTEYSDVDYQNAFSYALTHAIKDQDSWKKLTYTIASKKHGDITKHNIDNQKRVDSLAYFQAGTNIISNKVYASGVDIQGFAQLQQILEKVGIEEEYRIPIDALD